MPRRGIYQYGQGILKSGGGSLNLALRLYGLTCTMYKVTCGKLGRMCRVRTLHGCDNYICIHRTWLYDSATQTQVCQDQKVDSGCRRNWNLIDKQSEFTRSHSNDKISTIDCKVVSVLNTIIEDYIIISRKA